MIEIDGSFGEGGGQILRSALALSLITQRPVHLDKIRRGRKKPGLLAQHLTAVNAAARIASAEVTGAKLGSQEIVFRPNPVVPGEYSFNIGTAGSTGLVLQTVLMPLVLCRARSIVRLEGGTHNRMSPPFDFLARAFFPAVAQIGINASLALERPGFYPQGGGRFSVTIEPHADFSPLELRDRGRIRSLDVRALVSKLPATIGEREIAIVDRTLDLGEPSAERTSKVEMIENAMGPGNVLVAELRSEHATEVFTSFGEKGKPAEKVAEELVLEIRGYLDAKAAVGEHLQDQLLLPLALAEGGRFRTVALSSHTTTNLEVLKRFLELEIEAGDDGMIAIRRVLP
jgi:RNA 3'-terminal phosphate cyclase (ATP)